MQGRLGRTNTRNGALRWAIRIKQHLKPIDRPPEALCKVPPVGLEFGEGCIDQALLMGGVEIDEVLREADLKDA